MNLLELQVLAVVSRMPNGTDAPSPESVIEPARTAPNRPAEASAIDSAPATDARNMKQPV